MKSLTTIALLGSLAAAMATGGEAHGYAKKPQPPTALTAAPEYDHHFCCPLPRYFGLFKLRLQNEAQAESRTPPGPCYRIGNRRA